MRPLAPLVALLLPMAAHAQAPYTLEEVGAMAPGQRSFTNSPLLPYTGIPEGPSSIEPTDPGERGGEYATLDIGNFSLVAGPWTYADLSGDHILATLNEFLGRHENEYDFVSIFIAEPIDFGSFYSPLQNATTGLGSEVFDQSTLWGFDELEGYLFMNSIFDYQGSPRDALFFGQEVGHRWGAYVRRAEGGRDMLGREDAHWSFFMESQNSTMEGNAWVETEQGVFETRHLDEIGYSQLDMYLMGFLDPDEVEDWFLIDNPVVLDNEYGWPTDIDSAPYYAVRALVSQEEAESLAPIRVAGDRVDISIEDVIAENGPRVPGWDTSQREFDMAFVLMMPASDPITFDEYLVAEDTAEELTRLWEELVDGNALLRHDLGQSGSYDFSPGAFAGAPTWEGAFDPTSDTGIASGGCAASVGGGSRIAGGMCALLGLGLGLGRRRRRGATCCPSP
ncbi:MAG: hypothetical protein KDA24_12980 [Deltaproteobacteria bacterium]|nr:hypothetical protein [Deltaproteobacteria bacterium]